MPLPGLNIGYTDGNLGQTPPSQSHYSGLLIYTDAPSATPSNFWVSSLSQAESLGIVATSTDPWTLVAHYHLTEFFRVNPSGRVFIRLQSYVSDYNHLLAMQNDAGGAIRQFAIHSHAAFSTSELEAIQARLDEMKALYTPAVAIVGFGKMLPTGVGSYQNMPNLTQGAVLCPSVAVMIGATYDDPPNTNVQNLYAKYLVEFVLQGAVTYFDLPNVGAALGQLSKRQLHENMGWVEVGNMVVEAREKTPYLADFSAANFQAISSLTGSDLDTLHEKGYVFFRTFPNYGGVFINDDITATEATSDYNSLRNNRVINEATRLLSTAYTPYINAPVTLDASGKLLPQTRGAYEAVGSNALNSLKINGNISAYEVYIDPDQNVLAANTIEVQARLLPIGCSKYINISLGFVAVIATS